MEYDTVYYWVGGTERGHWRETLSYALDMVERTRRMGYVARPGFRTTGSPQGPPSIEEFKAVGFLD